MNIKGIKGMTVVELQDKVAEGSRFVVFSYCISFLFISLKRSSGIYFISSNENAFVKSFPYTIISLLFGWWGIPWGIMHTFASLFANIKGGKDISDEVMQYLQQPTKGYVFEFEQMASLA